MAADRSALSSNASSPMITRAPRGQLLAVTLLLSTALVAGCTGSSGNPAATTVRGATSPESSPGTAATNPASAVAPGPPTVTTVAAGTAPPSAVSGYCVSAPASCYTPHLYRVAYGIQPLLDAGIDGRGETVTVVAPVPRASAGPPPGSDLPAQGTDIRRDMEAFDTKFRLPAARIQVVTSLAGSASPWRADGEEVGDFEIIHAVAPAATLRVVLMPANVLDSAANSVREMLAALRLAVSGTDVASISWSLGEHFFTPAQVAQMHSILLGAQAHHVTVIASSGDHDAASDTRWGGMPVKEVSLPASDPLLLGVGGTTLAVNGSTGAYIGESAWNVGRGGSGGGFSHLYARPAYQDGVPGISTARGVPDVSADAAGRWPFVSTAGGNTWIIPAAGTSDSAPLWGGLIALADQYAHHDLGFVNPAIYRIASSSSYHKAFHDITTGNNNVTKGSDTFPGNTNATTGPVTITGYQAAPGWDPVTGWGSPDAQVLIPLLARST